MKQSDLFNLVLSATTGTTGGCPSSEESVLQGSIKLSEPSKKACQDWGAAENLIIQKHQMCSANC